MKTEQCNNCGLETDYPESHDDIIVCHHCRRELFPCQNCDNWHDWSNKSCDYDEKKNGCSRFKHRFYKVANIAIGGNLADHQVICFYAIEGKEIAIKETWLVHNSNIRKITLRPFYEQVACDGIYGWLTKEERESLK